MQKTATHIADAPGDGALLARGRRLVGLALDAEVHDVITADSAVVDDDVPCPESYSVPLSYISFDSSCLLGAAHLLDFEALLVAVCTGSSLGNLRLRRGRISHVDVGHVCELW